MKPLGILIPAYKPPPRLKQLAQALRCYDFLEIIVVDDGSPQEFKAPFSYLRNELKITVLSHKVNRGKGAALKTGFHYFCQRYPQAVGVVTADADGQHLVRDILRVAHILQENPNCLILGTRQFDKKVPLKSYIGNYLTQLAFKVLFGTNIADTQTGLRGLPKELLKELSRLSSGHYAFETDSLITALNRGYMMIEVPISTVYIDKNASSHFKPVKDSLRILSVLFDLAAHINLPFRRQNNRACLTAGSQQHAIGFHATDGGGL